MAKRTNTRDQKTKSLDNTNWIDSLSIVNYKSIKSARLNPKRVNLFIGRPNVGKSNILEAICLLGSVRNNRRERAEFEFSNIIRYDLLENLFFEQDVSEPLEVRTNIGGAALTNTHPKEYVFLQGADALGVSSYAKQFGRMESNFRKLAKDLEQTFVSQSFGIPSYISRLTESGQKLEAQGSYYGEDANPIKKYIFEKFDRYQVYNPQTLEAPNGQNLYGVLHKNRELFKRVADIFKDYNLRFVLKQQGTTFELQHENDGVVISYPYDSVADTLQRFIFYLAAIVSNTSSILLLEEPEVHAHPAFIREMAQLIINDQRKNQFFITTHSPFILNIIAESVPRDQLNIYKTQYKNFTTEFTEMSEEEMSDMLDYGTDMLFKI